MHVAIEVNKELLSVLEHHPTFLRPTKVEGAGHLLQQDNLENVADMVKSARAAAKQGPATLEGLAALEYHVAPVDGLYEVGTLEYFSGGRALEYFVAPMGIFPVNLAAQQKQT